MNTSKQLLLTSIITVCFLLLTSVGYAQIDNRLLEEAKQSGVDQSLLIELENRSGRQGVEQQHLQEVLQSALAMTEQELPAEIAIQKALEGFSKGIPASRVVSVVKTLQQSMSQAVQVVDPWVKKPVVQEMIANTGSNAQSVRNDMAKAVSKSLRHNISAETVTSVFEKMEEEAMIGGKNPSDIVAAVTILSDLPEGSGNSVSLVMRALKGGFVAEDLHRLPAAIKMGQQRSQLPAASVMEGFGRQVQSGASANQVLQNLFEGNVSQNPGGPPNGIGNSGRGSGNGNGQGNGRGN